MDLLKIADVSVTLSLYMTLRFFAICMIVVMGIIKTGYRFNN